VNDVKKAHGDVEILLHTFVNSELVVSVQFQARHLCPSSLEWVTWWFPDRIGCFGTGKGFLDSQECSCRFLVCMIILMAQHAKGG